MNILIVTQMYPQPSKKIETNTVEYFAKEWVAMGHNVKVFHCPTKFPLIYYHLPPIIYKKLPQNRFFNLPSDDSRSKLNRTEFGIDIYRIPVFKWFPGQALSEHQMKFYTKEIIKACKAKDFQPDLVAGHFANPSVGLVSRLARYYSAKSSIVFHHDCTETNIIKYHIQEKIKYINAIGARSIIESNEIKNRLRLEKLPFVCCSGAPNDAVENAERICAKHDYKQGIHFIYVGTLILRKHVAETITAFNEFQKNNDGNHVLEIIGAGSEEDNLRKLVSDLRITDKVIFTGRIPRNEVIQKMKNGQVFTLISHGETFGIVYIEAMLQGCLTIASKGEGFDGIIKDGENGFICEPGDSKALTKIYNRIAEMTTEQRNKIGQAAIDTAIHYSEREVAERYLNDILNNQR